MNTHKRVMTNKEQEILDAFLESKNGLPLIIQKRIKSFYNFIIRSGIWDEDTIVSLNRILPVFKNPEAQKVWEDLNTISEQEVGHLFYELLSIEYNYNLAIRSSLKIRNEIKQAKKVINAIHKLETEIEVCYNNDDSSIQNNWNRISKNLKKMKLDLNELIDTYKSLSIIKNYPAYGARISRKNKDKSKSLCMFYMNSIHFWFTRIYHKPMYENIATLVNAIFGTEYTGNNVCKNIKPSRKEKKELLKKLRNDTSKKKV